jgi:hypothetical protein
MSLQSRDLIKGRVPKSEAVSKQPRTTWRMGRVVVAASFVISGMIGATSSTGVAQANEVTDAFRAHAAGSALSVDHSAWVGLLKTYVKPASDGVNRVDYKAFKANGHAALKSYIAKLEAAAPAKLDKPEQMAFWINLYNAKTIDIILAHYPVKSIREIDLEKSLLGFLKKSVGAGGPWKTEVVKVAGRALSLDNIEHDILRPIYKDPRIHYAVNCASYGCPNLQRDAFTGATLDDQLDAGARAFINHPRGLRVEAGRVMASSIYDWFQSDFGGTAAGVLDHARCYASPELKAALDGKTSIDSFDYDWRLNDIAR